MLFKVVYALLAVQASAGHSFAIGDETFDYVVVGGGTSGSVIATRLAQHSFKVALVEAGGLYEFESLAAVPAADVLPAGSDPNTQSVVDWGFVTRGQPGANGRAIHYARGKCLGGSSALNFMIYQRPTRDSMQEWADAVDDESYTFDNVLPFYKRSPHFTAPNSNLRASNATAGHNSDAFDPNGGPLQVSYSNYAQPFSSWMNLGMQAIGINDTQDFNSGSLMGGQYCSSTIDPSSELRSSSQTSFLTSIKPLTLKTYSQTLAKKIVFNEQKKATGVQVRGAFGNTFTLPASKEVIISAGAFQSPQLLMVSGVGPADELKQHEITVVADRPGVGQNMWDHPFFAPSYRVQVNTLTKFTSNFIYTAGQLFNGVAGKSGPLTNPVADYLAWEKIPQALRAKFTQSSQKALSKFPSDWPEAEYISGAGYIGNVSNLLSDQPKDGCQYASILGVLVAPSSRGNITIKSSNTDDLPVINPNWLYDPADQEVAIAMFKRIRAAFKSDAMAPVVIGEEYYPGVKVQSDSDILEFIKNNVMTLWHAACTCKMGKFDDDVAVVDAQARVYGVQGLRVVDASAFPFLPPGHPQSTVYMLAEKISDAIINGS
ncbi:versicolorin B synthase [Penicillium brasilianum]|uniref:Versicolorin B synthase n=1 Tax=Penicillium brasilianum TaxID=104259 RepID=A0A1S9RCW7_PENBI|nr:versicolorin B synthase [Penicillium brasilianum]